MKKKLIFSIIVVLIIVIVIVGATYSYFISTASSNNSNVTANSEKYEIVYHGGTEINSDIKMLSSHEGADSTTVEIGLASGVNVAVSATLFIKVTQISSALAVEGFKWEIYRVNGANEILENSGNFSGAAVNSEVPILTTPLTTTLTSYKVYLWLDGSNVGNEIMGTTFKGYIGAKSDILTGIVNNS